MSKPFKSQKFKTLLPYFLLALAIIAAYRISGEMNFFLDILRRGWGIISPFFAGFILAYIVNIPIGGIQKLLVLTGNKILSDKQRPPKRQKKQKPRGVIRNFFQKRPKLLNFLKGFVSICQKVLRVFAKFILKRQKMLSVISVAVITVGIITLALNFIIPAIVDSIAFFIANIPVYWDGIVRAVEEFNNMELFGWHINAELIFTILGEMFADFDMGVLAQPLAALAGVGVAVFNGLIAFISSIYILVEKDKFKVYLRRLLRVFTSEGAQNAIIQNFSRLNHNIRQYVRTQTIDGLILGTMATIALALMGSPYALILGIMLGIVNYIPYFGSIFGTIVAVLVVTLTQGLTMGAISAVSLLVIQQIDANIVQPRLMSGSFSLSPLLVIISITFGGAMAGIFGMIIAIPIVAVLKDIFDGIVNYCERKKFGTTGESEGD